jgi:hypothetical protein
MYGLKPYILERCVSIELTNTRGDPGNTGYFRDLRLTSRHGTWKCHLPYS